MHGDDEDEDGEGSNSDEEKPAKKAVKPAAGAPPQGGAGADGKQECKQQ